MTIRLRTINRILRWIGLRLVVCIDNDRSTGPTEFRIMTIRQAARLRAAP